MSSILAWYWLYYFPWVIWHYHSVETTFVNQLPSSELRRSVGTRHSADITHKNVGRGMEIGDWWLTSNETRFTTADWRVTSIASIVTCNSAIINNHHLAFQFPFEMRDLNRPSTEELRPATSDLPLAIYLRLLSSGWVSSDVSQRMRAKWEMRITKEEDGRPQT